MGINPEHILKLQAEQEYRKLHPTPADKRRLAYLEDVKKKVLTALAHFDLDKIYIFGSLVKDNWNPETSDIDIAIDGADAVTKLAQIDKALVQVLGWDGFDLVPMEYAEKNLAGSITYEGELIYSKENT